MIETYYNWRKQIEATYPMVHDNISAIKQIKYYYSCSLAEAANAFKSDDIVKYFKDKENEKK